MLTLWLADKFLMRWLVKKNSAIMPWTDTMMKDEKRQFVVLATIGCRFLLNVLSPKLLKELDLTEGRTTGIPTIQKKLRENGSPKATWPLVNGENCE